MDVLESLNGMLIKGLGCGLGCKDHLELQNVPLEMSVISAQTRQLCWPADAPCSTSPTGWLVWTLQPDKNSSTSTNLQQDSVNETATLCDIVMEEQTEEQMEEQTRMEEIGRTKQIYELLI